MEGNVSTKEAPMSDAKSGAVVFDFDGVLVESLDVKAEGFYALYSCHGEDVASAAASHHLKNPGTPRAEKISYIQREFLRRELSTQENLELCSRLGAIIEEKVANSAWVNGAFAYIQQPNESVSLHIASASPLDELVRIVKRRRALDYFQSVHGYPESKESALKRIIGLSGYEPARVIMIGDALTDYNAAKTMGTLFIGRVPHGSIGPFPSEVETVNNLRGIHELIDRYLERK